MLPKTAFKYEDERWTRRPHDRKVLETSSAAPGGREGGREGGCCRVCSHTLPKRNL